MLDATRSMGRRRAFSSVHGRAAADALYAEREKPLVEGFFEQRLQALRGRLWRFAGQRGAMQGTFVKQVCSHGSEMAGLSDSQFPATAADLGARLRIEGFDTSLVARTFALIREAADRSLGQRHYEVQLAGGWAMLNGALAEMATGEGKTLAATLPACTAALAGLSVHVITVNDYLAARDAQNLAPLFELLGLTVGLIQEDMSVAGRREAYRQNIAYCTNKQLAFDYLRDKVASRGVGNRARMLVDRMHNDSPVADRLILDGLQFAIVDEADSVLIDEARTPLILSDNLDMSGQVEIYRKALSMAEEMCEGRDFKPQAQARKITLTTAGKEMVRQLAGESKDVWASKRQSEFLVHQALVARELYHSERHYLVKDGKIQIIDEFTGRLMPDRAWEAGLHQMIEVKEGCEVTPDRRTLAKITYQRLFRRYQRLAGMTGTATEVAGELWSVYRLNVVRIPPNTPRNRSRWPGRICRSKQEKWQLVITEVQRLHGEHRPVLIGTRSVESSEVLSAMLDEAGLTHSTLNARQDENEANKIASAGQAGCITVATNMAGRGTDIRLSPEALASGGLHVMLAECNELPRIDRQLAGRCARQGDPGSYLEIRSLEDGPLTRAVPSAFLALAGRMMDGGSRPAMVAARLAVMALYLYARNVEGWRQGSLRRRLLQQDEQSHTSLGFAGAPE